MKIDFDFLFYLISDLLLSHIHLINDRIIKKKLLIPRQTLRHTRRGCYILTLYLFLVCIFLTNELIRNVKFSS